MADPDLSGPGKAFGAGLGGETHASPPMSRAHAFTRKTITTSGGDIALIEFGDANRPVDIIFSHANGFNALTYRAALGSLGGSLRIVAPDLRGHGRTSLPLPNLDRYGWADLLPDLITVMDAVSPDRPVILAGHSMGASLGLMAAEQISERVRKLVLFEPVIAEKPRSPAEFPPGLVRMVERAKKRRHSFDSPQAAFDNYKGKGAFAAWPDEVLADYLADGFKEAAGGGVELSCPPQWEASNFAAQGQGLLTPLLESRWPTMVRVAAAASTCHLAPDDVRIAQNLNLEVTRIAGTSHFLPMERTDVVRETLLAAAL